MAKFGDDRPRDSSEITWRKNKRIETTAAIYKPDGQRYGRLTRTKIAYVCINTYTDKYGLKEYTINYFRVFYSAKEQYWYK